MRFPWQKDPEPEPKDEPYTYDVDEQPAQGQKHTPHLIIERHAREEDIPPGVLRVRPGQHLAWDGTDWVVW